LVEKIGTALTTEEFGSLKSGDRFGIYADTCEQVRRPFVSIHLFSCLTFFLIMIIVAHRRERLFLSEHHRRHRLCQLGRRRYRLLSYDTTLSHILADGTLLPSLAKVITMIIDHFDLKPKCFYVYISRCGCAATAFVHAACRTKTCLCTKTYLCGSATK
jgi:hypothetical protein